MTARSAKASSVTGNRPRIQSLAPSILAVNGGSSSIKFALFEAREPFRRVWSGKMDRLGLPGATFTVTGAEKVSRRISAPDQKTAANLLLDWIAQRMERSALAGVGHRVVHGGPRYWKPQKVTPAMIRELRQLSSFDPEHLPEEIQLTEAFHRRFADLPQIACFDTAFHHDLPRVAHLLPIPRRYDAKGIRRYGFHGLSCEYLMRELDRVAGARTARGRVIVAHLGGGASVTAVRNRKSVDTSMSFTPTAGLPMGTRSGDLDPGLGWYFARAEKLTAKQFHRMVTHESGMLGVSEISSDMRELMLRENKDVRAAEAVALFCYQTRKWICAFAGALEGLDTLIFSGGIGENSPQIRARVCRGLDWMGIKLDGARNKAGAAIISADQSPVSVRVMPTDEERIIAQTVSNVLGLTAGKEKST